MFSCFLCVFEGFLHFFLRFSSHFSVRICGLFLGLAGCPGGFLNPQAEGLRLQAGS